MKHEPRGLAGPVVARAAEADNLEMALAAIAECTSSEMWHFPTVQQWMAAFDNLEEALPIAAMMEAGQRYLWWVTGDLAEALMRKFGRTSAVKKRLGAVFGCKSRTIEIRVQAAGIFGPEYRYPDVPTELYRECCHWPDAIERLQFALDQGLNSAGLRALREAATGKLAGSPIWTNHRARMWATEFENSTRYVIVIEEEGGARFANSEMDVVVSVSPLVAEADEAPGTELSWVFDMPMPHL